VNGTALGIDADIHAGVLRRSALAAFASHQPQKHFILAPQNGGGRLGRRFGPNSHFGFDQIAELEPLLVIVGGLFVFKTPFDAVAAGKLADVIGDFKI